MGHHQGKFLATETGYHGIREELGEQPGQVAEQLIADGMAPVIVDLLEMIHIEHAQGELRLLTLMLLEPLLPLVEPVTPVVEPGQVVAIGGFLDAVELLKGLQIVADPALQLLGLERLVEKIVRPLLEVAGREAVLVRHRDADDGELLLAVTLTQHPHQADAVDFRHVVIHQHQANGRVLLEQGQGIPGAGCLVHQQQLLAQLGGGAMTGSERIIDHQHFYGLVEVEAVHQADGVLQGVP